MKHAEPTRCGETPDEMQSFLLLFKAAFSEAAEFSGSFEAALELAQRHHVGNLLYYACRKLPPEQQPPQPMMQELRKMAYAAASREEIQQRELAVLFAAFEERGLYVLPLKGAVVRQQYPSPEMRYMSDIDLLIVPTQAREIRSCMEQLAFQTMRFQTGDVDLYLSPLGMYYEVHRDLSGEGDANSRRFLAELMQSAVPQEGFQYVMQLPQEIHYAYLLCHFAKHFCDGGIGVRAVMDVWFCRNGWEMEEERLRKLLESIGLLAFSETVERLARVWFAGETPDALSVELGEYILRSGAFGTQARRVIDRMARDDARKRRPTYLLYRLFPPFSLMRGYFPVLNSLPVLLPFFWCWRIVRALLSRRAKLTDELEVLRVADQETVARRRDFFQRCGLPLTQRKE